MAQPEDHETSEELTEKVADKMQVRVGYNELSKDMLEMRSGK